MNKQGPGGIEWCDFSWNPIKGLCPEACWFCYARAMYRRFKMNPTLLLDPTELLVRWPRPCRIFICSTMELFHPDVPKEWRDCIFNVIRFAREHTFIILTKRPERIDRPMPDNVHLGVSVTCRADLWRIDALSHCQTAVPFVSFEPLLEPVVPPNGIFSGLKWAVVGKLTGHGKKHDPARDDIALMLSGAKLFGVPVFMKQNIASIWGGKLVQEYPI